MEEETILLRVDDVQKAKKTVREGLGNFPTRGICITDALLASLHFMNYKAGA